MLEARFHGTWGSLFKRELVSGVLTLLTAGLFRPWAIAARWRWIADSTEIPEPDDTKTSETRIRRERRTR
jgi:uncharacterized membrane protein YjgN (DUF898 family)